MSCRVHDITRLPAYKDRGFLRTDYDDVEDYSQLHITFDDGTVADVFATELVLGAPVAILSHHRADREIGAPAKWRTLPCR